MNSRFWNLSSAKYAHGKSDSKLSVKSIESIGLFNAIEVGKMLKEHMNGSKNYGEQLFMLMVCQVWVNKYDVKV